MTYQLHCFAQSGHSYKVALMLELMGEPWEAIWVDFFNGAVRSDEFRSLNEMGEAPVLIDGPITLTQSGVILDYLSSKHRKFSATSADERREILRWMFWDNHKLSSNLGTTRFMMNFLPEEKRSAELIAFFTGRARGAMKTLDQHLSTSTWIVGAEPTIADLSCIGYLFFTDEAAIDMGDFPHIAKWRDAIAELPGWKHPYDLMPGHPLPAK